MSLSLGISLVMMGLGGFRFGVNRAAYQKLTRETPFRWPQQDRVGVAPGLQFLGPDVKTMTLEGVIYPHFKGGLRQVELMAAIARLGRPMMMVDGLGWVWDRWVIERVTETKEVFMSDGAPLKITFTVELKSHPGGLF